MWQLVPNDVLLGENLETSVVHGVAKDFVCCELGVSLKLSLANPIYRIWILCKDIVM